MITSKNTCLHTLRPLRAIASYYKWRENVSLSEARAKIEGSYMVAQKRSVLDHCE
jgi:hypothetical protein